MRRAGVVHDEDFRRAWSALRNYCQACGIHARDAQWPGLSTHHIIKPGRSDEKCNLLKLCGRCHDLAELRTIRVQGRVLPTLPWPVCCSLKATREAEDSDLPRLAQLLGRLITPAPIPGFFEDEFRRNRPWDCARFAAVENLERPAPLP